jgi:hypothetical protein
LFQRRLPSIFDQFAANGKALLSKFHQSAIERAKNQNANAQGVTMLSQQIFGHEKSLDELPMALKFIIAELQRDANREFVPVITKSMEHAYRVCTEERGVKTLTPSLWRLQAKILIGPGSYARMKVAMTDHVNTIKETVFRQACDTVKTHLENMCCVVQKQMKEHMEDTFMAVSRDYLTVMSKCMVSYIFSLKKKIPPLHTCGPPMISPCFEETKNRHQLSYS